jgi:hypothetical protein
VAVAVAEAVAEAAVVRCRCCVALEWHQAPADPASGSALTCCRCLCTRKTIIPHKGHAWQKKGEGGCVRDNAMKVTSLPISGFSRQVP